MLIHCNYVLENELYLVLILEHSMSLSLADLVFTYDKIEQDNFINVQEITFIARDLLKLLSSIHSMKKVLFSIKPENIYFSSDSNFIIIINLFLTKFFYIFSLIICKYI